MSISDDQRDIEGTDGTDATDGNLEQAAAQGPLPGVQAADAAEEEGREDSSTVDPDERADDAADGDVVGGINMH